jgi:hypothetical protein
VYVSTGTIDIAALHGLVVDLGFFVEDCFQYLDKVTELDRIVVPDIEYSIFFVLGLL